MIYIGICNYHLLAYLFAQFIRVLLRQKVDEELRHIGFDIKRARRQNATRNM
jgi:hypothetical protein